MSLPPAEILEQIKDFGRTREQLLSPLLEDTEEWHILLQQIEEAAFTIHKQLAAEDLTNTVSFVTGNSRKFASLLLQISGLSYDAQIGLGHISNSGFYEFLADQPMNPNAPESVIELMNPWRKIRNINNLGKSVHVIDDYTSGNRKGKAGILSEGLEVIGEENLSIYFVTRDNPEPLPYTLYGLKDTEAYDTFKLLASSFAEYERFMGFQPPLSSVSIDEYYHDEPVPFNYLPETTCRQLQIAHKITKRIATNFEVHDY